MIMSFYDEMGRYEKIYNDNITRPVKNEEIIEIIKKDKIDEYDFLKLLKYEDKKLIEIVAAEARKKSLNHFGKEILLYSPMYISNICVNRCLYCSFNNSNDIIERIKLTPEEVKMEGEALKANGIEHILVLTGEEEKTRGFLYLKSAIEAIKNDFASISIEVSPMDECHYDELVKLGVDGVTIYQETYHQEIYKRVHIKGPKSDYRYRLETPERAARANVRTINIGALLGLSDWRREIFMLAMHIDYLNRHFPGVELGISLPRIKNVKSSEKLSYEYNEVSDRDFVIALMALRLFSPYCSINISTRETSEFRKHLIPIGINKMSAGVSTSVGGYSVKKEKSDQFEIADKSSVKEVKELIKSVGYQPIMKDWVRL